MEMKEIFEKSDGLSQFFVDSCGICPPAQWIHVIIVVGSSKG